MNKCCCTTKKNKPCPINADRKIEGKWYCHIHDPQGTFKKQQKTKNKLPNKVYVKLSVELTLKQLQFVHFMLDTYTEEEIDAIMSLDRWESISDT